MLQGEGQQYSAVNYFESAIGPEILDPCLGRLLSLFPNVASLHIPVRVALPTRGKGTSEKCMIQFGGKDTVIFTVNYPVSCGEAVRVRPSAGPDEASAIVIAMVPRGRGAIVAVRFLEESPRWISMA